MHNLSIYLPTGYYPISEEGYVKFNNIIIITILNESLGGNPGGKISHSENVSKLLLS